MLKKPPALFQMKYHPFNNETPNNEIYFLSRSPNSFTWFLALNRAVSVFTAWPATTDAAYVAVDTRSHGDNEGKKSSTVLLYSLMPLPQAAHLTWTASVTSGNSNSDHITGTRLCCLSLKKTTGHDSIQHSHGRDQRPQSNPLTWQ